MKKITGLQTNIDQFTLVFLKENYANWTNDCSELKQELLTNSLLAMNDETFEFGRLQGYNTVTTLRFNGNETKIGFHTENPKVGVCVSFTAMAFKSLLQGLDITAYKVYQDLYKIGSDYGYTVHLSRVDVAADLFNQSFVVNDIAKRISRRTALIKDYRGRKNNSGIEYYSTESTTNTIYIGSKKKSYLRIYNKQQEQWDNHGSYLSLANSVENWTRFEYVLRGAYSRQFSEKLLQIRDNRSFNSLLLQTITDRYRFISPKGNILGFSKLMLNGIKDVTPSLFAPKTRLNNHDLVKRADYYKSPNSGLIRLVKDLNNNQGTDNAKEFLNELILLSGMDNKLKVVNK